MVFGIFESALSSEQEVGLARQASVDKQQAAIYDVREKLGSSLFAARDIAEFRDRVAMMKNDQSIYRVIEPHIHPSTGVVRSIVGKNSVLEREFRTHLADKQQYLKNMGWQTEDEKDDDEKKEEARRQALRAAGLLREADFEGEVDTDRTFKPSDSELVPEGNFEGYLNSVDQGADGKVDRNFTSARVAWTVYTDWCGANGLHPGKLASLDLYAPTLPDGQYFRLARLVQAWEFEHSPKTPKGQSDSKLKDVTARQRRAVSSDSTPGINGVNSWGDPTLDPQGADNVSSGVSAEPSPGFAPRPGEPGAREGRRDPLQVYIAWCRHNGYRRISARNVQIFAGNDVELCYHLAQRMQRAIRTARQRQAGEHDLVHPDRGDPTGQVNPYSGKPSGTHDLSTFPDPADEYHWKKNTRGGSRRQACYPGCEKNEAHAKKFHNKEKEGSRRQGGAMIHFEDGRQGPDMDFKDAAKLLIGQGYSHAGANPDGSHAFMKNTGEQAHIRRAHRRQGAPDYLQKADDALTQLLNQKATEFQETIAPLQQALVTVQQAEQIAQQSNPLNVLPPAGTVNVMPGSEDQGPAGMPAAGAQDLGAAAQALAGPLGGGAPPGGAPPPGGTPAGGGPEQGAPPPEMQQMQARRRPRQASSVFDLWNKYQQSAPTLRGDDSDYDSFASQFGVGQKALNKLKQHHQTGTTVGSRLGFKKGAPFAGYSDFESCEDANDDKRSPSAYCGEIKHRTEDKEGRRRRGATWPGPVTPGSGEWNPADDHILNQVEGGGGGGWVTSPHAPIEGARHRYLAWCRRHRLRAASVKNFYWYTAQVHPREAALLTGGRHDDWRDPHFEGYGQYGLKSAPELEPNHNYEESHSWQDAAPLKMKQVPGKPGPPRHQARTGRQVTSWSGWGPAVFPKTRQVTGWDWDNHLNGYLAHRPQHFACECGDSFPAPSGFHRCACGRQWNSYPIGTTGPNHEASVDKFIVREIPVRDDVIVANRQLVAWGKGPKPTYESKWSELPNGRGFVHPGGGVIKPKGDGTYQLFAPTVSFGNRGGRLAPVKSPHENPQHLMDWWNYTEGGPKPPGTALLSSAERAGALHNLIDPGEIGEGTDDGMPTYRKPPKDWARRGDGARWQGSPIGA